MSDDLDDVFGAEPNGNGNGESISDRAEAGEEPAPEELFPFGSLAGDELSPQKLIKRGLPIEVTVALGQAEVPLSGGGLLDPEKSGRVLITYAFWKNVEVPTIEDGKIVAWKIRQMLRATFVKQANDEAQLIEDEFAGLVALDPERAAATAKELVAQLAASEPIRAADVVEHARVLLAEQEQLKA